MSSSIFGAPQPAASNVLLQMKAGKLTQSGTTVTADPRKGLLLLQKSDDDLMHLIWKDRSSNTVEDDLIIFQGDATLKHLPQCKTGYAMLLEFTTGRKSLFWSQEPRKKGTDWEDIAKESELMNKANGILNGSQPPAAAPSVGFGGMTHSELLAMLSGGAAPAAAQPAAAEPSTPAPAPAPATTDAAAPFLRTRLRASWATSRHRRRCSRSPSTPCSRQTRHKPSWTGRWSGGWPSTCHRGGRWRRASERRSPHRKSPRPPRG
mmetsp:Transcript_22591/g.74504  ORF Transcript_22591/g.74504 Transcript_22591/m.74504 type:complete len:263 (+) Transcript_22591:112-900(+)